MRMGLNGWLMTILTVSLFCALAEALMPEGPVRKVGKLVCGLALLCGVLIPVFEPGAVEELFWQSGWSGAASVDAGALEQQLGQDMKRLIEQRCAAYIQDKAEQMGVSCTIQIVCKTEGELFVPDRAELTGPIPDAIRGKLARVLEQDLGIPQERQVFLTEEDGHEAGN